jgi:hypothetical protein
MADFLAEIVQRITGLDARALKELGVVVNALPAAGRRLRILLELRQT